MRLVIRGGYPSNWRETAARVKAEAGNRCIRCGHPDGDKQKLEGRPTNPHGALRAAGIESLRRRVKYLRPCDDRCSHPKDGKLRQLTVHHLDGDKSNGRWWNLLALCQLCHLTIQGKCIPERPFLWEHSDWFKPYAAGFYAYWYGLTETTREQVSRDLDFYLQMGQPWLYERAATDAGGK